MEGLAITPPQRGRLSSNLFWGGVAVAILIMGAASALFIIDNSRALPDLSSLEFRTVRKYLEGMLTTVKGALLDESAAPAPPVGDVRTYPVKEGETLWSIARKSNLVDHPWEWRSIVVQNKRKIDYTFVSEDTGQWKVVMEGGQNLQVVRQPPTAPTGAVIKKFALQLATVPAHQRAKAVELVKRLLANKRYAYFYMAAEEPKPAYRIRSGFYETRKEAERAARGIKGKLAASLELPPNFLVVVPSIRELRGELFEFGAQRTRPWVIQFPHRASHAKTLRDLETIWERSEFAYIAQKRLPPTGVFQYKVRVGYFPSAANARQYLDKISQSEGGVWEKGKVIHLRNFSETLPGQQVKIQKSRP